MSFVSVMVLAVGLAADALAVAVASAASGRLVGLRSAARLAFHFGLFQGLMPVVGWLVGTSVEPYMRAFDHWIAFGLLAFVGGRMLLPEKPDKPDKPGEADASKAGDPSRGWSLVALSVATSIDAFAVGLSLAAIGVSIWYPAAVIGVVTAGLSLVGARVGERLGLRFGRGVALLGGLLLIGLGLRILVGHLTA